MLNQLKPDDVSWYAVYQRMRWSKGQQHTKRHTEDLRFGETMRLALAAGVPVGPFALELMRALKVRRPPKPKPKAFKPKGPRRDYPKILCKRCGGVHQTKRCKTNLLTVLRVGPIARKEP